MGGFVGGLGVVLGVGFRSGLRVVWGCVMKTLIFCMRIKWLL